MGLIEALLVFLMLLIVIVAVALLIIWAASKVAPEFATPVRYVVGLIALLILLVLLLQMIRGDMPKLV